MTRSNQITNYVPIQTPIMKYLTNILDKPVLHILWKSTKCIHEVSQVPAYRRKISLLIVDVDDAQCHITLVSIIH